MPHLEQFYVKPDQVFGDRFELCGDEAFHAIRVKRHKIGDRLCATDGRGKRYFGLITKIEKDRITVSRQEMERNVGEPGLHLTVAQAVLRGNTFDLVVEKGTEIGVSAFQPIVSAHSIGNPAGRLDRWQAKALAAMKQCGRTVCPEVREPMEFAAFLEEIGGSSLFIAHPGNPAAIETSHLAGSGRALVLVGPEGGFSDGEVRLALARGAIPLDLGQRRLRSETAGLVAAVKILHTAGDI